MKQISVFAILFLILAGCKESPTLKFCEGKSPEGKEINCGSAFSPGDLTFMVFAKDNFEVSKLTVNVYIKKRIKKEKLRVFTKDVKPDEKNVSGDISFYEEGSYSVDIIGKENLVIGSGDVRILDIY